MSSNCIGLDIGSSSIKVVALKLGKKGMTLSGFGIERLPPQTIVDGTIMNQSAVVDAIRVLWSRLRLRHKDVAIAISGHFVIIKKISLPKMTDDELEEQIPWEAEQHIPFDRDEVELDYVVVTPQTASGQMEVLLVAAKKDVVHDYAAVAREASLKPRVVDVCAFTVQNAFEASYPRMPGEAIVLVNIGATTSNINVVRDGVSLFTRDVTIGGNAFTEEIRKQLGVTEDEAEAYKIGGEADDPGLIPREVEPIVEQVAEVLSGEFQRTIDFFLATSADVNLSRLYLAGGGAKVYALQRALERRSRLAVEVLNAWKSVTIPDEIDTEFLRAHGPEAMVGLGLALRSPGDKA